MKIGKCIWYGILCRVMCSAHQLSEKFKIEQHSFYPHLIRILHKKGCYEILVEFGMGHLSKKK